jgi:hypothetical protein
LTKKHIYLKIKEVRMDPKTPANLDPKLKEVYDRVMGTANPASSPPPQTTPQPMAKPLAPSLTPSNSPTPPTASPFPANPIAKEDTAHASTSPLANMSTKSLGSNLSGSPSVPPTPAHSDASAVTSPLSKPVVDYAALAAKFATPTPTINAVNAASHPVTPSTTTYGVVDNKPAKEDKDKNKDKTKAPSTGGSSMKKILLIAGIPVILIGYTAVWVFVFHLDIMSFLPLPK